MGLKEIYNSHNPNIELIPKNGWWEMRLRSEAPETALAIGVLFHSQLGWGYWDRDEQGKPIWVDIEVPEKDPVKLHDIPNHYETGRIIAYMVGSDMTSERAIELICANCGSAEERISCLQGIHDARAHWGWKAILVKESDLKI